jgi:zinc/manganese transport system permease protein
LTGVISPNLVQDLQQVFGADFMRHAYLAATGVAAASGVVGYFLVLRNQVFTGDALSHVAFAGALAAAVLGADPLIGVFASTVLIALGMGALGGRARARDVVIGTVFAWILGLGALFLSVYTSERSAGNGIIGVRALFGSILGIDLQAALAVAAVGAAVLLVLAAVGRPLLFASVDQEAAAARGVPVSALSLCFIALVALTVAESVQAVGALLVFGLLVAPAVTAQVVTSRPYLGMAISAGLALLAAWAGLFIAFYTSLPPSFTIVAITSGAYVLALALERKPRLSIKIRR